MVITRGQFLVNLSSGGSDQLTLQLRPNSDPSLFPENLDNATVAVTLDNSNPQLVKTPLKPGQYLFNTDAKGSFHNLNFSFVFSFNARKHLVNLKLTQADLKAVMGLTSKAVVNGHVDLPIKISINNGPVLSATARFVYNTNALAKGVGKNPITYPNGN